MFSQFSIRQLLIATAGAAILISIVATGISQGNPLGNGVVVSLCLLPVLFLGYCFVTVLARMFCGLGNSLLGPLEAPTLPNVVVKRQPLMADQEIHSNSASIEATDEN